MSIINPQRDAIEQATESIRPWNQHSDWHGKTPFKLTTDQPIYLLGVSTGVDKRPIAVFQQEPPPRKVRVGKKLLAQCHHGALVRGPTKECWCRAKGLALACNDKKGVVLRQKGRSYRYRQLV